MTRTVIPKTAVPFSTSPYDGVKTADAANKIVDTSEFPESRPFLVKGKSQKALSAQDPPAHHRSGARALEQKQVAALDPHPYAVIDPNEALASAEAGRCPSHQRERTARETRARPAFADQARRRSDQSGSAPGSHHRPSKAAAVSGSRARGGPHHRRFHRHDRRSERTIRDAPSALAAAGSGKRGDIPRASVQSARSRAHPDRLQRRMVREDDVRGSDSLEQPGHAAADAAAGRFPRRASSNSNRSTRTRFNIRSCRAGIP